ncbi:MAG TPA: hypothetical protein VGR11_14775 [Solirubrobacteraceae bacterium]|nr:hypothetical protein [Solirubrobacteraceae bacterium]
MNPNRNTERLGRTRRRLSLRLPTLLALIAATMLAAGCGDDDVSAAPDISDITSDPADYVGQTVELRGEVAEIFYLQGGFLLDESDGGGDDLIVYGTMLPLGVTEGDEVEVDGTVRLVDDDFREEAGDQFFDDLAFKDVEGQAAIDASTVVDPTAPVVATSPGFGTLDANGDSYLDDDEIRESADVSDVFDTWNADADSELDRDQIAGNAFRLWDRDGNRRISEEEWRTGTELWYPEDVDVVVFDDADADGDSELDADEVAERFDVSGLGEAWTPSSFDESRFKRAYFSLYDTDDDGRVSKEEWEYGANAFGTPAE